MKEELFDRRVRDLLDSCSETPPQEVWNRIEAGLDRRRRRVVWKNLAYGAAAAAVAAGMLALVLLKTDEPQQFPTIQLADLSYTPRVHEEIVTEPLTLTSARDMDVAGSAGSLACRSIPEEDSVTEQVAPVASEESEIQVADVQRHDDAGTAASSVPSIYDKAGQTESAAGADFSEDDIYTSRKKPSFSLSASGNLSPTRATGNVDFSQPNYSWGAGGTSSSTGIVPVSEPRHYFPVSVGLELKYSFLNERLGVGLGLNYTFLNSRYEALVDRQYQASVDQSVHYLGIPLNFYVNILSGDRIQFYADAGCMMERAVKVSYEITDLYSVKYQQDGSAQGLQWSVNVGLGLEYRFLSFLGVYVDPRLTYFFDCGQPYSVRTEQPLQFNLQMGFRFHI